MLKVFVYGALMHTHLFKQKGHAAKLNDHAVSFTLKGLPFWEPAFAEVIEVPGMEAWGVVAEVTTKEWEKIRRHEISYHEKNIVVKTKDNQIHACIVLVQKKLRNHPETIPSARYMRMLYSSARYYQFPGEVISRYQALYQQGNRRTLYMPWVTPTTKTLIPYLGVKKSFYISSFGLPLLIFFLFMLGIYH